MNSYLFRVVLVVVLVIWGFIIEVRKVIVDMIGLFCWLKGVGWCDRGFKKKRIIMNRCELNWVYIYIVNICIIIFKSKVMFEYCCSLMNFGEVVESISII